jgi:hypothetical protein
VIRRLSKTGFLRQTRTVRWAIAAVALGAVVVAATELQRRSPTEACLCPVPDQLAGAKNTAGSNPLLDKMSPWAAGAGEGATIAPLASGGIAATAPDLGASASSAAIDHTGSVGFESGSENQLVRTSTTGGGGISSGGGSALGIGGSGRLSGLARTTTVSSTKSSPKSSTGTHPGNGGGGTSAAGGGSGAGAGFGEQHTPVAGLGGTSTGTGLLGSSGSVGTLSLVGINTATPEPGSLLLFGSGLIGMASLFRRRLF